MERWGEASRLTAIEEVYQKEEAEVGGMLELEIPQEPSLKRLRLSHFPAVRGTADCCCRRSGCRI